MNHLACGVVAIGSNRASSRAAAIDCMSGSMYNSAFAGSRPANDSVLDGFHHPE